MFKAGKGMKRGKAMVVAAASASVVLCLVGAMAGCQTGSTTATGSTGASVQVTADTTMQELAEVYPLQYNSYATLKQKSDDLRQQVEKDGYALYENKPRQMNLPQGHYAGGIKELAPLRRADDGSLLTNEEGVFTVDDIRYDPESGQWVLADLDWPAEVGKYGYVKGCFACKSTAQFDKVYAEEGAGIYTQPVDDEFLAQMNGQEWSCDTCHAGNDFSKPADATGTHFLTVAANELDWFDSTERVCGQCHSDSYYYPFITDQETFESFDMYRNGYELEGLLQTQIEDGVAVLDEETGVLTGVFDMPTLEMLQDGTHRELGLTCVSCHMPTVTDSETGETYTDHDASGSPLEKEASLELCLSCHTSQGIGSAEEMVDFVHDKQHQAREGLGAARERSTEVYDKLKVAVKNGKTSEDKLDQARNDYAIAAGYLYFLNADSNGRAIHNGAKCASYLARANELLDKVENALSEA